MKTITSYKCNLKRYLNSETSTVTIVTPADGPSLPTAPAGKWIWTSVRSRRSTPSSDVRQYYGGRTDSQTDGRTDRQADKQKNRQKEEGDKQIYS